MKKTILLVEDDQNQRDLYEEELREEGYEVITSGDGRTALRMITENSPDLVIMDINMPVMDGLDALSHMMEHDSHIPVIINSAYASYQESFSSWAADAYIVKSSDLTELKQTVKRLLEGQNANS
jgi:DNA-binding NtrC family response regulator